MSHEINKDDEIITVTMPVKDYKTMREMIEERQALAGFRKLFSKVVWFAAGALTLTGVIEVLRKFA